MQVQGLNTAGILNDVYVGAECKRIMFVATKAAGHGHPRARCTSNVKEAHDEGGWHAYLEKLAHHHDHHAQHGEPAVNDLAPAELVDGVGV